MSGLPRRRVGPCFSLVILILGCSVVFTLLSACSGDAVVDAVDRDQEESDRGADKISSCGALGIGDEDVASTQRPPTASTSQLIELSGEEVTDTNVAAERARAAFLKMESQRPGEWSVRFEEGLASSILVQSYGEEISISATKLILGTSEGSMAPDGKAAVAITASETRRVVEERPSDVRVHFCEVGSGLDTGTLMFTHNARPMRQLKLEPGVATYELAGYGLPGGDSISAWANGGSSEKYIASVVLNFTQRTFKTLTMDGQLNRAASFLVEAAPFFGFSEDLHQIRLSEITTKKDRVFLPEGEAWHTESMITFIQVVRGVPVEFSRIMLMMSFELGTILASGKFHPAAQLANTTPAITEDQALHIATSDLGVEKNASTFAVLYVYPAQPDPKLVWIVTLQSSGSGTAESYNWTYRIDAMDGAILNKGDNVIYD